MSLCATTSVVGVLVGRRVEVAVEVRLTRLLQASYTPLTRLLHVSYTPITGAAGGGGSGDFSGCRAIHVLHTSLHASLHASYMPLTRLVQVAVAAGAICSSVSSKSND